MAKTEKIAKNVFCVNKINIISARPTVLSTVPVCLLPTFCAFSTPARFRAFSTTTPPACHYAYGVMAQATTPTTLPISEEWEHVDPTQIPSHTDLTPSTLPVTWWAFATKVAKAATEGAKAAAEVATEGAKVASKAATKAADVATKAATEGAKAATKAAEVAKAAAEAAAEAAGVCKLTLTPPEKELPSLEDLMHLLAQFLLSKGVERAPAELRKILGMYAQYYGSGSAKAQVRAVESLEKLQAYLRRTFWLFLEVQGLQECKERAKMASLSIQLRSVLDARESVEVERLLEETRDTIALEKRQQLRELPSPPSQ